MVTPGLFQREGPLFLPWSTGAARYISNQETRLGVLPVTVSARLGTLRRHWALLDTAASWSVVGAQTAGRLGPQLGEVIGTRRIATRVGDFVGELRRVYITLVADLGGEDLGFEPTCLVIPDWRGPDVLGYNGCLERVRFALDPGPAPDTETFYFGPVP